MTAGPTAPKIRPSLRMVRAVGRWAGGAHRQTGRVPRRVPGRDGTDGWSEAWPTLSRWCGTAPAPDSLARQSADRRRPVLRQLEAAFGLSCCERRTVPGRGRRRVPARPPGARCKESRESSGSLRASRGGKLAGSGTEGLVGTQRGPSNAGRTGMERGTRHRAQGEDRHREGDPHESGFVGVPRHRATGGGDP
jgi:hypothetical protein